MSYSPDEHVEPSATTETPPSGAPTNTDPVVEVKQEVPRQLTPPVEFAPQSVATTDAAERLSPSIKERQSPASLPSAADTSSVAEAVNKVSANAGDTVDAPVRPPVTSVAQEMPVKTEEPQAAPSEEEAEQKEVNPEGAQLEEEGHMPSTKSEPPVEVAATPVETAKEDTAAKPSSEVPLPLTGPEPAASPTEDMDQSSEPQSAPVNLAEPPLSNGLPQEAEELSEDVPASDTTPQDKPDPPQSQEHTPVAKTAAPAQKEEKEEETREEERPQKKKTEDAPLTSASFPEQTTMQGEVERILIHISSLLLVVKQMFKCVHLLKQEG